MFITSAQAIIFGMCSRLLDQEGCFIWQSLERFYIVIKFQRLITYKVEFVITMSLLLLNWWSWITQVGAISPRLVVSNEKNQ